jgi:uncharacterized small protein (DUF1192 family)
VAASLLLAGAVLAGCLVHAGWMNRQIANTWTEVRLADRPRLEAGGLAQRISLLKAELEQLQADKPVQPASDPAAALALQRTRIGALLTVLGRLTSDDRVVTAMRPENDGGIGIEGLSLSPESADDLAVDLARACRESGWQVSGARKTARLQSADGGPWDFRITVAPPTAMAVSPGRATVGPADEGGRIETPAGGVR